MPLDRTFKISKTAAASAQAAHTESSGNKTTAKATRAEI